MRVRDGEVRLGGLVALSFQRYPRPSGPVNLPVRSWGALPVARVRNDRRTLAVPLGDDEACWVGVSARTGAARPPARARLEVWAVRPDGFFVNATTGQVVPRIGVGDRPAGRLDITSSSSVDGVPADGQIWPFGRPVVAIHLRLCVEDLVVEAATVRLLAPCEFTRLTGQQAGPPLEREAVYGGWRLP